MAAALSILRVVRRSALTMSIVTSAMAAEPQDTTFDALCCQRWIEIPGTGTFDRDFNCLNFLKSRATPEQAEAICKQIADAPFDCPEKKHCSDKPKCSASETARKPDDGVDKVVTFMKKQLKDALQKVEEEHRKASDAQKKTKLQGDLQKLKQALGYWDQIQAATCVPADVVQATNGFLSGQLECPQLCGPLKSWFEKLTGMADSEAGNIFWQTCTSRCHER